MRKHPRVDTTTTGEAIHYVKKDLHTQAITHDIRSSYQLLIYPRASESPSLLPIRDVSYTSRKQLPIQDAHVSRKISCLPIRILPTLDKTSLLDYPSPPDSNQGSLALSTKLHSLC